MPAQDFRSRMRRGDRLIGTFVKTPAHALVEILGTCGFDFVVVDAEHSAFDRQAIDLSVLAARSVALPLLVRTPDASCASMQTSLDSGATGVLVPHVLSEVDACEAVRRTRYRRGERGFSNSPRAGGYGKKAMDLLVKESDANTVVVCQIEDAQAIDEISRIASVHEVDCLFIGRADLAVALDAGSPNAPEVADAVRRICEACQAQEKAVGIFLADESEVAKFITLGISVFVIGSDQSLLRAQAVRITAAVATAETEYTETPR